MEAIGQLTGGLAHDFNNLLTVVLGNLDLARRAKDTTRLARHLDLAEQAAERGARLTHQLLAFARRQQLDPQPVDVNALVRHVGELGTRTLGERIELGTRLDADLWTCRVDATQLELTLLNVLLNARDAMEGSGRVLIETCNVAVNEGDPMIRQDLRPGRYVLLAITDSGHGMSADTLERACEPFFTTKGAAASGLGLAQVYGFAKQSEGHLTLYSETARGTTVRLYLPATEASAVAARPPAEADARGRGERILLVEDNDDVRDTAASFLESLGYRVVAVPNGAGALSEIDGTAPFDLIFSDLVMPGAVDGVTVADRARAKRPSIRVLLTTGFTEASLEMRGSGRRYPLLGKPYRQSELASRVRAILDEPCG
jgi:CheY-like chemotaxis protein